MSFTNVDFAVPAPDSDLPSLALQWRRQAVSQRGWAEDRTLTADERACRAAEGTVYTAAADMVLNDRKSRAEVAEFGLLVVEASDHPATVGAWHDRLRELAREPRRLAGLFPVA